MARKWVNVLWAICFGAFYCRTQSIISNIRDIITAASDFVSGVNYGLKKLGYGVETVEKVLEAASEENCDFICPKGQIPIKKASFKMKPNGCGAYGVQMTEKDLPVSEMKDCCDRHDLCYGTCNSNKEKCDSDFQSSLYKTCDKNKKRISKESYKNCKTTAKLLYLATLSLGCKAFKDAQNQACICVKSEL